MYLLFSLLSDSGYQILFWDPGVDMQGERKWFRKGRVKLEWYMGVQGTGGNTGKDKKH